jgi:site-specific recombinase XerD
MQVFEPQVMAPSVGDLEAALVQFQWALKAQNKSVKTVETYSEAVHQLGAFLADHGMPTDVASITREHVEMYLAELVATKAAATASNRYRALKRFFAYLAAEGDVTADPTANMEPPRVPQVPVTVLSDEQLAAIVVACKGRDLDDVRDLALIRMFIGTGARLAEITGIDMDDFDRTTGRVMLRNTKGRVPRTEVLSPKSVVALAAYLRQRPKYARARSTSALWVGARGPLTPSGVRQIVRKRAEAAGIPGVHPHMFRHAYADAHLKAGGEETTLMSALGWSSRAMVQRYAAANKAERGLAAQERLALGDRV